MSDGQKQPRKLTSGRNIPLSQLDGRTVIELEGGRQTGAFIERLCAHFRETENATIIDKTRSPLGSKPNYPDTSQPGIYLTLAVHKPNRRDRLKEDVYRIALNRLDNVHSLSNYKPLVDMLPVGRTVQLYLSGEQQPLIEAIARQVKTDFPSRNEYPESKIFFLQGSHQAHAFLDRLASHYQQPDGKSHLTVVAASETLPGNSGWSVSHDAGDKKDPLLLTIDTAPGHMRIRANSAHPEYATVLKLHNLARKKPAHSPLEPQPLPELFANAAKSMGPHEVQFASHADRHKASAELAPLRAAHQRADEAGKIMLEYENWDRLDKFDGPTLLHAEMRISGALDGLDKDLARDIRDSLHAYYTQRSLAAFKNGHLSGDAFAPVLRQQFQEIPEGKRKAIEEGDFLSEESPNKLASHLLRLQLAQAAHQAYASAPSEKLQEQIDYLTEYLKQRTAEDERRPPANPSQKRR